MVPDLGTKEDEDTASYFRSCLLLDDAQHQHSPCFLSHLVKTTQERGTPELLQTVARIMSVLRLENVGTGDKGNVSHCTNSLKI